MTNTSDNNRSFDLVVFGATSFVGQILCSYLVSRHGIDGPLRWAIGGRDEEKLQSVADATGADVEQIVANAADTSAMNDLARSTRAVVSTVGPYALYGSELVAAAAAEGTDYCDLAGEPLWMQRMIDAHQAAAAASGARLVHSCGFDSIPSDMGVWFTQREAANAFGTHCSKISMRVKAMKGAPSGGTIASGLNAIEEASKNSSSRQALMNPYSLAPAGQRDGVRQPNVILPKYESASGQWVAPFVMAGINTRIVHRSHALLGHPWGQGFLYDEAMMMGGGPLGAAKSMALVGGLGGFVGAASIPPVRSLLANYVLPKPGEGPSPEVQAAGFYDLRFFGETAAGEKIQTKVTGDADPGYGSTAKMLGEAAVALLDLDKDDVTGGFHTPSTAFGDSLIDRLTEHAGMTFRVVD